MTDYNGWTNRDTWLVALWVDNNYDIYMARESTTFKTAKDVQRFVFSLKGTDTYKGLMRDAGRKSLKDVNWDEILEAWSEE